MFDVARFYLAEVGIDGWRLDVAHQIDPAFWAAFRAECKAARADCLLVGEMMHGNYTTWVGPTLLDSAINCQLSKAVWSSLNNRNFTELVEVRGARPPPGPPGAGGGGSLRRERGRLGG